MSARESIAHVKQLRSIVYPNRGFGKQLDVYGTRFVGNWSSQSQVERISKVGGGITESIHGLKSANGLQDSEPASNTGPEGNQSDFPSF